mgnify:CR=1 FL=1
MYSIMLDKVSKSYQTNNYVVKAVNQADFAADKGTSVAIIGPSGSGKSTLLNMMGLIIYPDFGRILINGEDVTNLPDTALCHFRNSYFGYVVQDFALLNGKAFSTTSEFLCYTTRKSSAENTKNVSIGQQKAFSFRISCIARSNSFPAANVKELPLQEPLSVTNR